MGRLVVATVAVCALVSSVQAQVIKKGELSGRIVTVGVLGPAGGSAVLYTAPDAKEGRFILSKLCAAQENGNHAVLASSLGSLEATDRPDCTDFSPGLALPPGEQLTCRGFTDTGRYCVATGVLSRK